LGPSSSMLAAQQGPRRFVLEPFFVSLLVSFSEPPLPAPSPALASLSLSLSLEKEKKRAAMMHPVEWFITAARRGAAVLSFWIPILISFIPLSFFAARVVLTNQLTTNNNRPDVPFCECVVCVGPTFSSLYCAHSVYIISTVYIYMYMCMRAKVQCTVSSTLGQHCLGYDNKKKGGKKRNETTTRGALFAAFEIVAQSAPLELPEGAPLTTIGDTFR